MSLSTSYFMSSCLSGVKFLFFCFTVFQLGSTFSLWVINSGLMSGISATVHAKTSLLSCRNLVNLPFKGSWSDAPMKVTFSGFLGEKRNRDQVLCSISSLLIVLTSSMSSMGKTGPPNSVSPKRNYITTSCYFLISFLFTDSIPRREFDLGMISWVYSLKGVQACPFKDNIVGRRGFDYQEV